MPNVDQPSVFSKQLMGESAERICSVSNSAALRLNIHIPPTAAHEPCCQMS